MNRIYLVILMLASLGCSHIAVVGFNKDEKTVSIQGGKWASDEDYQAEAAKYCGGPATVVSMGQGSDGTYITGNGYSAVGVPIRRWVYTYRCN